MGLIAFSTLALASGGGGSSGGSGGSSGGSGGSSGGSGGSGGGGGGDGFRSYDIGKKVFHEKIVCASCPYADVVLDKTSAKAIFPELKRRGEIGKELTYRERRSARYYLKKRFGK